MFFEHMGTILSKYFCEISYNSYDIAYQHLNLSASESTLSCTCDNADKITKGDNNYATSIDSRVKFT